MILFRISNCKYVSDLSGKGAALYGGRWNSKDVYVVYTAQSRALALLESVVHMGRVPQSDFCIVTIEIPDDSIQTLQAENLPSGWYTNPPPDYLKAIGDSFIKTNKYLALEIPSVLMTEEYNILLNPAHRLFSKVKITSQRILRLDERLFPSLSVQKH